MLENFKNMEIVEIKKEDELYPEKLREIINPPKKIYAIRKYRITKRKKFFSSSEVDI